jgi:UDP-N-acetylglucosamine 2-epimerase (non-hydrolysing)
MKKRGRPKILAVVGARPNFMKVAPIWRELEGRGSYALTLVHTGQHYDDNMSKVFFDDLELPRPDVYLGVGSGSHAEQTARVMVEFEKVLGERRPDLVIVVGDVNSTMACTLVAAKMEVAVAHVEAGLRSFDRSMPEEINRMVTDILADLLFTTSPEAETNLLREGVDPKKIHFVGNVMIDSLRFYTAAAEESTILEELSVEKGAYGLVTLHRPSNVDDPAVLRPIIEALCTIGAERPLLFPVHPRTRNAIEDSGLEVPPGALRLLPPVGYLDFLKIMAYSCIVLTDSGGIQEETTALGIPCLTIRENTERPVTIAIGTNTLVGMNRDKIVAEARRVLREGVENKKIPELWDGKAASRIATVLESRFYER